MDALRTYIALRLLARLLRSGDPESAGQELDRQLDGVAETARGCCIAHVVVWYLVAFLAWAFAGFHGCSGS